MTTNPASRPSGASTEPHPDVKALASWLRGAYGHAFPRVDWESDAGEILDLFASDWRAGAASTEATPPPLNDAIDRLFVHLRPHLERLMDPRLTSAVMAIDRIRRASTEATERPGLLALLADLVSFQVANDAGECSWCEVENPARTTDHRPSCPWRRAQEIVHASR